MDLFQLMKRYWEWAEANNQQVNCNSTALYFYLLNLANTIGWKKTIGVPTVFTMNCIGISNYKTYQKAVKNLEDNKFIFRIKGGSNQYQSPQFALVKNTKANTKPLSEQIPNHIPTQSSSTVDIDKLLKTNKDNINVRVINFVNYINKTFGKKYRVTEKVKGKFKARVEIDKYESQTLQDVIISLKNSTYHIETNYKYCTPEFCLRVDKIEMYKSGAIIHNNQKNDSDPQPPKSDYSEQADYYHHQQSLGKVTTTGS